ncbi:GTPase [Candidatus Mycoplasma haematominutum]|nr:GTPase [Candidatus Mycoplasma haematominutum]
MGGANSGKSSFINLLVKQQKAKRTAEPGTTRGISRHKIPQTNLLLYDCPGFFPDKADKNLAALLQLLNFLPTTPDSAINYSEWGFNYLLEKHPTRLKNWINLADLNSLDYYSFLKNIALKYKLIEKKGELSLGRAEEKFINLVRKGEFGRITWELS